MGEAISAALVAQLRAAEDAALDGESPCPPLLPGLQPVEVMRPPEVVEIRTPDLHGPLHDWFIIPRWMDAELHRSGIEHEHREGQR